MLLKNPLGLGWPWKLIKYINIKWLFKLKPKRKEYALPYKYACQCELV
jgi:hypothetical protein